MAVTKLPIMDLIGGQYFVRRTPAFISDDNGWQNSEGQSTGEPVQLCAFGASRSGTRCNWVRICDQCRLWQRNSPAAPANPAAFWKEQFKNSLFQFHL
jgi:hypothetical protein